MKLTSFCVSILLFAPAMFADKKVKMEDLPPAVQAAVKELTKNATLVGLGTEVEKGKTLYEVETKVNGKSRDLELDATGKVLEVEEEIESSKVPAAAMAAIQKKAGKGTITKVESVTQGSVVSYEATVDKGGKKSEVAVSADGTPHK